MVARSSKGKEKAPAAAAPARPQHKRGQRLGGLVDAVAQQIAARRGGRVAPRALPAEAAAAAAADNGPPDEDEPEEEPEQEEEDAEQEEKDADEDEAPEDDGAPPLEEDPDTDDDLELAEEHDDGNEPEVPEAPRAPDETAGWSVSNRCQFSQRATSKMESQYGPRFNLPQYESKPLFEWAIFFLPMIFIGALAELMQANGEHKFKVQGQGNYKNWRVTSDDVLQYIGCRLYALAFHQPGGMEQYFDDAPKDGFGPTFDLKAWLKVGCPTADRGIGWFNQMHACFELPTHGKADDPFNRTRRFWDALRDAFCAAVVCSWIMCLDESMLKWLGQGMPGFMYVQRKPTPKGLELHTLCCGVCGILLWFEVYEGKKAMEKKEKCAEQKRLLGASGPWRSVALTLRMVEPWISTGRVLIADSWFGSVPCILALYTVGIFAVMNVKTAHKGFPKDLLLSKLGFDKKTKLCPKARRGEAFAYTRTYDLGETGECTVLAAGHNSKKPVLVVSTAGTMLPATDYTKTWTFVNAIGELVKYTVRVATTMVHAMYHRYYGIVDTHNHLRQGLVSFADAWPTKDWADRHFAEGLGFWEVNVYKALVTWHPVYKRDGLSHPKFRKMLAHTLLTLGKAKYGSEGQGAGAAGPYSSSSACAHHHLARFDNYDHEKHQCGFCPRGTGAYFYCTTCFPDGQATHALCNPTLERECYGKHAAGMKPTHTIRIGIKKKNPVRSSPRKSDGERRPTSRVPPRGAGNTARQL